MKFGLFFTTAFFTGFLMIHSPVSAAPIGVPGATVGKDQSTVGLEFNFLLDRDLDGAPDTEGMTVLAKGQVGLTQRVDLLYRFGFGRFESNGKDSDAGPAFGVGAKVTWAAIDNIRLKIGSVAQMLQIRADKDGSRMAFKEYDFALGVYLDSGTAASLEKRALLTTYGGLAFSAVEVAGALEDNSVGVFAGLLMKMNQTTEIGAELRFIDQTALAVYANFAF